LLLRPDNGPVLPRSADKMYKALLPKQPPRTILAEEATKLAQLLQVAGEYEAPQSSVHSHTFPAKSAWPHLPSPFGDFVPTFCVLLHELPQ